jgi:hypothetical protein
MGDALVESFSDPALAARPIRGQTHRKIPVTKRQHRREELPRAHCCGIVTEMLAVPGRG